jgi:hypothetical protein
VTQNTGFAWNHGDYAAEINTTYVGLAGPGVDKLGVDGSSATAGPNSAGPDSGQTTVPDSGTTGTWVDQTDIRPTVMYLAGLHDDYESDGRVISEVLSQPGKTLATPSVQALGQCYKQLNSSVGEFGTSTLIASTAALQSTSLEDRVYTKTEHALSELNKKRDKAAGRIKQSLEDAEFAGTPLHDAKGLLATCTGLIRQAENLNR